VPTIEIDAMGYGSVAVVVDPPTMTAEHPSASSPEARAFDDVDDFTRRSTSF